MVAVAAEDAPDAGGFAAAALLLLLLLVVPKVMRHAGSGCLLRGRRSRVLRCELPRRDSNVSAEGFFLSRGATADEEILTFNRCRLSAQHRPARTDPKGF